MNIQFTMHVGKIRWIVVYCILVGVISIPPRIVLGLQGTVGDSFESDKIKETGCQGIFLLDNITFPEISAVYKFSVYAVATSPAWLQVWRRQILNTQHTTKYILIGQKRFQAKQVPQLVDIPVGFRTPPIIALPGDRLAIFNEEDICPMAYKFLPGSPTFSHDVRDPSLLHPGFIAEFERMSMPYEFSVKAYYDTNIDQYTPPTGTMQTTEQNPPRLTIPSIPSTSGTFRYIGNGLAGKSSYLRDQGQGMYLFPHLVVAKSVLVKFYAYFARKQMVVFQVWRPYSNREEGFVLAGEYAYEPDLIPDTKEIDLQNNYIFVEEGDVIGFTCASELNPIGYSFISDPTGVGPQRASIIDNKLPEMGQIVNFNPEKHPYDFAFGAIYDTDTNPNIYGTRPASLPPYNTPSLPPLPRPDDTIPPLIINVPNNLELLGDDYLMVAPKLLQNGALRTFLLPELSFPVYAVISTFMAYIRASGTMHFQIWSPVNGQSTGTTYRLVASKRVTILASSTDDFQPRLREFKLTEDDDIFVSPGDCIGFANEQEVSVVGYQFLPAPLYTAENGLEANVNESVVFDMLSFPYKFAIGALYREVERPDTTPPDTDDDETDIKDDDIGDVDPLPQAEEDLSWVMDESFLFGLFIWLCVLTALFLLLFICVCVLCYQKSNQVDESLKRTSFLYDYESKNSVTRSPSAYLSNKETMNYFNPQTGNRGMAVVRGDSMRENLIQDDVVRRERRLPREGYSNNNNNNSKRTIADIENDFSGGDVVVISHVGDMQTHM